MPIEDRNSAFRDLRASQSGHPRQHSIEYPVQRFTPSVLDGGETLHMGLASIIASDDEFEVAQACDRQGRVVAVTCVGIAQGSLDAADGVAA